MTKTELSFGKMDVRKVVQTSLESPIQDVIPIWDDRDVYLLENGLLCARQKRDQTAVTYLELPEKQRVSRSETEAKYKSVSYDKKTGVLFAVLEPQSRETNIRGLQGVRVGAVWDPNTSKHVAIKSLFTDKKVSLKTAVVGNAYVRRSVVARKRLCFTLHFPIGDP